MLFLLYGEDAFRSRQKFEELKEKYLKTDQSASGLSVFDMAEADKDVALVLSLIETPNLLMPKRLIVLENAFTSLTEEEQDKLADFLKQSSVKEDKDTNLIFFEEDKIKEKSLLAAYVLKNAQAQKFEALKGIALEQWALKRIKAIAPEGAIEKRALGLLVSLVGTDTAKLDAEIQKLLNYSDDNIKLNDVEAMVNGTIEMKIFDTLDALASGQKKKAAERLHEHLKNGDDPFLLFAMFTSQFRNILKVADYHFNRGMNETQIARVSSLHPFVIKKSLWQIKNYSWEEVKAIYAKLSRLDEAVKTGQMDIRLALDTFLVEI